MPVYRQAQPFEEFGVHITVDFHGPAVADLDVCHRRRGIPERPIAAVELFEESIVFCFLDIHDWTERRLEDLVRNYFDVHSCIRCLPIPQRQANRWPTCIKANPQPAPSSNSQSLRLLSYC